MRVTEKLNLKFHAYLGDLTRMANACEVVDSLIVVPELDDLIIARGDEVLTLLEDGESVELARVRAIEEADGLTIVAVPVADLAIRTGGEELRLIGVVHDLLEHGRFKEAHDAVGGHNVPNDARAVVGGRNSLAIVGVDSHIADSATVLLERGLHDLSLHTDLPDADLTLHTTGNDAGAVIGGG